MYAELKQKPDVVSATFNDLTAWDLFAPQHSPQEFFSRSWIIDAQGEIIRPGGSEVGFWRPKPNKVLEVVLAHNTGISEGWVGVHDGPKIQLAMDQGYSAPTAKIVTAGSRLYGLVEGQLFFAYDMAAEGQTLQAHIWSSLERQENV